MNVRRAATLAIGLIALLVTACGGPPARSGVESLQTGCATSVRAEFERQQSLVDWPVYCPSELPGEMRLATGDDTPIARPNVANAEAHPTWDQMYEPDPRRLSTFITRLTDGAGRDIVIVQGAGASIYNRRDEARCTGCFEVPRRGAMFGDLSGRLYVLDPAAVIAWNDGMGHMIAGYGISPDDVTRAAASMAPVTPPPPSPDAALLRVIDLSPGDWLPDDGSRGDGEDFAQRPVLCDAVAPLETPAPYAGAFFYGATWPYDDGHPPSLHQALFDFDDEGSAAAYITDAAARIDRCVASAEGNPDTLGARRLPYVSLGDGSAGYRHQLSRSEVQGADADYVFIRSGRRVTVLWYFQLVAPGASPDAMQLLPIAAAALFRMDHAPEVLRAPGVSREFVRWNADGTFLYRQAVGAEQQATWFASSGLPFAGTTWLADPRARTVARLPRRAHPRRTATAILPP